MGDSRNRKKSPFKLPGYYYSGNQSFLDEHIDRATLAGELGVCNRTIKRHERSEANPDGLRWTKGIGEKLYTRKWVIEYLEAREYRPSPRRKH